jgi:hypothetical protein
MIEYLWSFNEIHSQTVKLEPSLKLGPTNDRNGGISAGPLT